MFDPVTAEFLRSAPALQGLDPAELPQILTKHYAELVARRLRRDHGESMENEENEAWPLSRIADTYELIASLIEDCSKKRAAAFVAGTAQQILAQEAVSVEEGEAVPIFDRDRVDPTIAAALLFLAAEQYADAIEAAQRIHSVRGQQDFVSTLLALNIRDLAAGKLSRILKRAKKRPEHFRTQGGLEARSTTALFETLLVGVELFAADVLREAVPKKAAGRFDSARTVFSTVLQLSSHKQKTEDPILETLLTTYPGPRHLAALLLAVVDGTEEAPLTKIDPPPYVDENFWNSWLRHRAETAPFTWHNHREAVAKQFHHNGNSAVMVLPTGAGKTTVSCLKIASVLGSGKNVVFIAPTHALVEQLTVDLQEIFPEGLFGSLVSSDFDRLFAVGTTLKRIEVMTPEHCLALLSYAPGAFDAVGLMVFDECHLLSPVSGLRRALDGMFCVLAFNSIAPDADFLFLSAMVRNGREFADWIGSITERDCIFVDPLWKPSRQARGIVFYECRTLARIRLEAISKQQSENGIRGKEAKCLRKAARDLLKAEPFAMFGLHHNWLHEKSVDGSVAKLSESPVQLGGKLNRQKNCVVLKPNVNAVAAHIAAASARNGLKTVVFVNVKNHAVSTARQISATMGIEVEETPEEHVLWQALDVELGGRMHSLLDGPSVAVPHNADMLRLERDLAERMFRRQNGAQVIVATPTLAQGLNLPAHLAILASDMRSEGGNREPLKAHEILNAAARAGRAGFLANGVVLLIPEEVLSFSDDAKSLSDNTEKLQAVLPEDDRCLVMTDPLQLILDRISDGFQDPDVEYTLNRFSTVITPEGTDTEAATQFAVNKTFAAYLAVQRNTSEQFEEQIECLKNLLAERNTVTEDPILLTLAAQSGASLIVLNALRTRLLADLNTLPVSISGWVSWIFEWLAEDYVASSALLHREWPTILGAVGRKAEESPTVNIVGDVMRDLRKGVLAWLSGQPIREVEIALGGNPDKIKGLTCPRARKLVSRVVPMGLTFICGLVARTTEEIVKGAESTGIPRTVLECLPAAVRRGFDSPLKVAFNEICTGGLSRVQVHQKFNEVFGAEPELEFFSDYRTLVSYLRQQLS